MRKLFDKIAHPLVLWFLVSLGIFERGMLRVRVLSLERSIVAMQEVHEKELKELKARQVK